jgi:hypothetical protein
VATKWCAAWIPLFHCILDPFLSCPALFFFRSQSIISLYGAQITWHCVDIVIPILRENKKWKINKYQPFFCNSTLSTIVLHLLRDRMYSLIRDECLICSNYFLTLYHLLAYYYFIKLRRNMQDCKPNQFIF